MLGQKTEGEFKQSIDVQLPKVDHPDPNFCHNIRFLYRVPNGKIVVETCPGGA